MEQSTFALIGCGACMISTSKVIYFALVSENNFLRSYWALCITHSSVNPSGSERCLHGEQNDDGYKLFSFVRAIGNRRGCLFVAGFILALRDTSLQKLWPKFLLNQGFIFSRAPNV